MPKPYSKDKPKKPKKRLSMRPGGDPKLKESEEQREKHRREARRLAIFLVTCFVLIVAGAFWFYNYKFGPLPTEDTLRHPHKANPGAAHDNETGNENH
ncbi:MAG: hypothetical protein AB7K09_20780 [Planctomycetota bacterium]